MKEILYFNETAKKKKIPKTVDFDVSVNAVFWGLFKSSLMIKLIDSHLEIYTGI